VTQSACLMEVANIGPSMRPLGIAALTRIVARRALAGEHLVIWGPRGSGKTTLLAAVETRLAETPCARASRTASLDDITQALRRAYPGTVTQGVRRRLARARLVAAADQRRGVLLLDHAHMSGTAMKGWLKRLRGGVVGIVLAVDVENARERRALTPYALGTATLRMPALAPRLLRRLLRSEWGRRALSPLSSQDQRALVAAARGRPGWILHCAALAADSRYWLGNRLRASLLCIDTAMLIRGCAFRPD
jgi:hypothetical protein